MSAFIFKDKNVYLTHENFHQNSFTNKANCSLMSQCWHAIYLLILRIAVVEHLCNYQYIYK